MKVYVYPFGEVEVVDELAKVPDGDFGGCKYEGSLIGEDYEGDKHEGRDIYSSIDCGRYNYFMV